MLNSNDLLVSRETEKRLQLFAGLLVKWQKSINLVSDANELWERHIIDSMQLLPYVISYKKIADLGSGAGFPGIVLAICGVPSITLIESDLRKSIFLKEAVRLTESNANVINNRIEKIEEKFACITARACAPLSKLLSLSERLWSEETVGYFLKGKHHMEEISEAQGQWNFSYETIPSITDPEGVIVKMSNVCRV